MLIFVGLGNPGDRYAATRHNIGFQFLDWIRGGAERRGIFFSPWRARFQGQLSTAMWEGTKILFFKPQLFYNESGRSVAQLLDFHKKGLKELFVVHDDLDLELGRFRLKRGGSAGGNKGILSLIAHLGSEFFRLRLGIGHPGRREAVTPWVLGPFSYDECALRNELFTQMEQVFSLLFQEDPSRFVNKLHTLRGAIAEKRTEKSEREMLPSFESFSSLEERKRERESFFSPTPLCRNQRDEDNGI